MCIRDSLKTFIGDGVPSDPSLRHDLDAAGIVSTGHRVKVNGQPETVIVVRGLLTPNDVAETNNRVMAQRLEAARETLRSSNKENDPPLPPVR